MATLSAVDRQHLAEDLWGIWESYLETKLFRDANIPEVNKLLNAMHEEVWSLVVEEAVLRAE